MGIRYHAIAVAPEMVERAAASLSDFLRSRPWDDPYDPEGGHLSTLDLDKAWREFQVIFGPDDSPSPAFELVRGDVTHTSRGWIPFERFLDPEQVRTISRDLADVDECFVMGALSGRRAGSSEDFERQIDYALYYLGVARDFTQALAATGSGLVYWIG